MGVGGILVFSKSAGMQKSRIYSTTNPKKEIWTLSG